MKAIFNSLLFVLLSALSYAQSPFNLNFETLNDDKITPAGWDLSSKRSGAKTCIVQLDSTVIYEGKYSLSISSDPNSELKYFGECDYAIPAQYAGKKIELRGYLKTENVGSKGFAGLWMRIDQYDDLLEFDNMEKRKITGTHDWQRYAITLPLDDEATEIHVGGVLAGTGKIWVDDLQLFIGGKKIEDAPAKKIKVYPAALDAAFNNGSGITLESPGTSQIENLEVLGKVWGFLKYYHPQVATGNYNWDFELFRILPSIADAKSEAERDQTLVNWIEKLGAVSPRHSCKTNFSGNYKMKPDLEWITNSGLSERLRNKLEFIFENRNQKKNYYIRQNPHVGNPDFTHEDRYENFLLPDAGYRMLSLFRYWNMVQYFFPYKYAIGEDWNPVLKEFIPKFAMADDALTYRLTCLELIARIHDTHASIYGDSTLEDWKGYKYAPFQLTFTGEQAVVSGYYNRELGEKSGLKPGDVIVEINGKKVEDIVSDKLKYYPASNRTAQLRNFAHDLLRGNDDSVDVAFVREGKKMNKTIHRCTYDMVDRSSDWAYHKPDSSFRFINPGIGYINIGMVHTAELDNIFSKFKNTRGIVIDIRNYPTDFLVFRMGKYLNTHSVAFVKFTRGDINSPGLFSWTKPLKVGRNNADAYRGKVVVLVNEITQSSAEYHAMSFRASENSIVIGSTTAGADGNISQFYLPGNLYTLFTGIGIYYPDGKETQRVGIVPDIEVTPTISGIWEGKDELLDRAIQVIESGD
ncbi:MAG TPA: S41 family peptidase [Chitinophagales bacterium]|nr:S41 family peptidase [Chitinophagales bacterium]